MLNFDILVNTYVAESVPLWAVNLARWIGEWTAAELVLLCAIVIGIALILKSKWRRASVLILSVFLTLEIVRWSKEFFGRARPENAFESLGSGSLPSGHAAIGAAFFSACIYVFAPRIRSKTMRGIFVGLCIIAIFAIGTSRIILAVHWTTDVVVGWILGVLVAMLSVLLVRYVSEMYLKYSKKL